MNGFVLLLAMALTWGVLLAACIQPEDEDDTEGWRVSVNFHDVPTNDEEESLANMSERHGGTVVSLTRAPPLKWVIGIPTEANCEEVRVFAQSLDSVGTVGDCMWWDNE